jgi:putative membrane protein
MTTLSLEAKIWFYLVSVTLILSGLDPVADRLTWWLETTPALIGLIVLSLTRAQFPLTNISYRLIAVFSLILIFGGHYTYAENPLFNWIQEQWALERNYYDRLGHFFQGVVPAMVGREILLRTSPLERGKWLFFILCTISLAISAFYELIEWWVALMSGEAADAFLGTQGDNWDTQWDMFLALTGSILAQLFLSKNQDRQLKQILSNE